MSKKIALIPGSFDPITKGHIDVIERAAKVFDEVHVLVAVNDDKKTLFTLAEKSDFVADAIAHIANAKVDSYQGLTVDYYKKVGACAIVRGIRGLSDLAAEEEYDYYNRRFYADVDTFLMFSSEEFKYLSSSMLKTFVLNDVDISNYVTTKVNRALKEKYQK